MTRSTTAHMISQYLGRYAEPQAAVSYHLDGPYDQAVVIPAFNEAADCLQQVFQHLQDSHTLAIAVVNAPSDASAAALEDTHNLLRDIAHSTPVDVLTIDCVSTPLNPKGGVGLARKIGTDVALALHVDGTVASPWLFQTDADAVLPGDYFDQAMPDRGAVVFAHQHVSDDAQLKRAAELYDLHMQYYVAGIAAAGSRYAYPTLGSTIAIHAHSYAAVRGYPKRNAGEDFYLLNKVAKVHGVRRLSSANRQDQTRTHIILQARLSERVPFGTGPALRTICDELQQNPGGQSYLSYHPKSFALLQVALALLDRCASTGHVQPDELIGCENERRAWDLLADLRFDRVHTTLGYRYPDSVRRADVVREWFDAGKTLRFIHEARRYYPDQPLLQTMRDLPTNIRAHLQTPLNM